LIQTILVALVFLLSEKFISILGLMQYNYLLKQKKTGDNPVFIISTVIHPHLLSHRLRR